MVVYIFFAFTKFRGGSGCEAALPIGKQLAVL